jgi:hypothetical protein
VATPKPVRQGLIDTYEVLSLAATQGAADTDTFASGVNPSEPTHQPVGVALTVITDIQYDESTFALSYRTRTLTWSVVDGQPHWAISAESALVEIATTEECCE